MSQASRILLALIAGLLAGIAGAALVPSLALSATHYAQPIGTAWLNALQMTIIPLVVALLVTGIAATAEAARASRLASRAIILFLVLLWISSALGALLTLGLLDLFPLPQHAGDALRALFAGAKPVEVLPSFADFITAMVPTNVIGAAATDAFLPLILFTTVFAFAVTRLPEQQRAVLTGFFQALADAMLVMINWVLWLAPVGVFALAYVVGARAGTSSLAALAHYVAIVSATGAVVWLLAIPFAVIGGRVPLGKLLRALGPVQAVGISTQSSLASLPAMLVATEPLGVPVATSGLILPLAVAIFRVTGPVMNLAVAIYVAHVFGIHPGPGAIAAGIAVAATTTLGAVSLPGAISYVSSIAPIAMAMGVPVEPLALLVAVETLPDLVRTLGNVTMDVAVTTVLSERVGDPAPRSEADTLLEATA